MRGVYTIPPMKTRIARKFDFHASHQLLTFPEGHKCRRLHGHTYQCEVVVEGQVDPAVGYFLDYGQLKAIIKPIEDSLDHHHLNDIPGLEVPTTEILAAWIWRKLQTDLPGLVLIRLSETAGNGVEYAGG